MRTSYLLCLIVFACLAIQVTEAQRPGGGRGGSRGGGPKLKLSGKVVDANTKAPLEYATISLFSQKDSSLVTGNITNAKGNFVLESRPGRFYAKVEFLAYQAKLISDIVLSKEEAVLDLGAIEVLPEGALLEEVVVRAEKSQMQMSLDKKVFNVGKDLASRGGNAADLLDNVPSVQVDVEGEISLRGSGNVRILVDGKPSGLINAGNSNGLRALPANMIEKIEVITNPSARYEAEGMAGIINIVLKKEKKSGLNGSFDFSGGVPTNYGTGVNLNYRTKKVNLFTNFGLNYRKGPGVRSQYQENYRGDTTDYSILTGDRSRAGLGLNVRVGADYLLNDKNTLTTSFVYRAGKDDNFSELEYLDYELSLENLVEQTIRTDNELEDEHELQYTLSYKKTFDKKGQELNVDVRYEDNTETEGSDLLNVYFNGDGNRSGRDDLMQRSDNKEGERRFSLQMDYVQPIGKEGTFEAGLRSSIRNINNNYAVQEFRDGAWAILDSVSNIFDYDEDIHAAYLIYGNKERKFSYQFGLRGEYSIVKTELKAPRKLNERDYLNLFPTAHLSYELPKDNAIQISYSRRVRRPRFRDLNPFFSYSDPRNFFSGNADIDPEFTNSFELGHIKYWDKGSLASSVYYRHTTGKIERIRTFNSDGTTQTSPQNLSTEDSYGLEFTGSYNPTKWWRLDGSFNFFRAIVDGSNVDQGFDADLYSWFTRGTSRFTVAKNTDVQVRYNYRAPRKSVQGTRKSMTSIDLAASRDIFKGKGTLTFSVRDLLNNRRYRFVNEGEGFYLEGDFQWRARTATLSLNYRLNQKKQRRRGRGGYEGGDGGDF